MIYESFKPIGEGTTGKVYRAFDRLMERHVAVKRIKTDKLQADVVEGVLTQTRALRHLIHPNLAVIYDVFRHEDVFIVTELFEGETLETLSLHGKMLFEQFMPFVLQVQEGMIAAHAREILHGGIKPENIMLQWLPSGSMHVKIIDFGLNRLAAAKSAAAARFMSPEQFEHQPLDARSDLYSLGCLYYFSLTQRYPFEGEDFATVGAAHLRHRVQPLQEARPDLPAWLCEWVMWHLERQPADRPESAMTAFQWFRQHAAESGAGSGFKRPVPSVATGDRYRTLRTKTPVHPHPVLPLEKRRSVSGMRKPHDSHRSSQGSS